MNFFLQNNSAVECFHGNRGWLHATVHRFRGKSFDYSHYEIKRWSISNTMFQRLDEILSTSQARHLKHVIIFIQCEVCNYSKWDVELLSEQYGTSRLKNRCFSSSLVLFLFIFFFYFFVIDWFILIIERKQIRFS